MRELLQDIRSYSRRRRGRQSNNWRVPEIRNRAAKAQIIRTEVVSPHRNAVRFIDRKQADL